MVSTVNFRIIVKKKTFLKVLRMSFFIKLLGVFFKLLHVRRRKHSIYWLPVALILKDLCGEVCRY